MATSHSSAGKHTKPAEPKREIPAAKSVADEAPAVPETSAIGNIVETPAPSASEKRAAEEVLAASFKFDSAEWAKKSFEIWSEHATAVLDLAEQIAKAKTLEEVVSLQSRFASERLDSFLRQSKDAASFAQSFFGVATATLCGARTA
jgi:hypothetical protein